MREGLRVSLGGGIEACLKGKLTLHGYYQCMFEEEERKGREREKVVMSVRAKEFCSFLVLVGRIRNNRVVEIERGLVARNKDEFYIPLKLSTIPSAKEFEKAVSSLSPTQQDFSSMFRSLQLSDSLFTIISVPLRPQLEKVMGVYRGDLMKEIKLSERLLKLLIEFQISPDLLSYSNETIPGKKKRMGHKKLKHQRKAVRRLKKNCKTFEEIIETTKKG